MATKQKATKATPARTGVVLASVTPAPTPQGIAPFNTVQGAPAPKCGHVLAWRALKRAGIAPTTLVVVQGTQQPWRPSTLAATWHAAVLLPTAGTAGCTYAALLQATTTWGATHGITAKHAPTWLLGTLAWLVTWGNFVALQPA